MANIPIKIYKDRVEIKNLKITETVEGISAETIGAADAAQVSELTEVVNKNYKNLDEKIANITNEELPKYVLADANGYAPTAAKLGTNAGSTTVPVFFSNGVPVACTSLSINAATATTLTGLTATIEELNYIKGATSNIQAQINNNYNTLNEKFSGYLPIEGGTLNGNLTVKKTENSPSIVKVENSSNYLNFQCENDGKRGIYAEAEDKWPLLIDSNGIITYDGKPMPTFSYDSATKTLTITT